MKKTSYQRLKDKLKESQAETAHVKSEFKKALLGDDFETKMRWTFQFKMDEGFEEMLWRGEPAVFAEIKQEHIDIYKDK